MLLLVVVLMFLCVIHVVDNNPHVRNAMPLPYTPVRE